MHYLSGASLELTLRVIIMMFRRQDPVSRNYAGANFDYLVHANLHTYGVLRKIFNEPLELCLKP